MEIKGFYIDELVSRIARSDEAAFRELFNQYYPRLLNYTFVIVKNHETAEDIVLEVLHSIWEKRANLGGIDRFENYLYVCTKNKTLDYHRKNSKLLNASFGEPHYKEYITHLNPEQHLLNNELIQILDEAILELPEKTRLVYRLIKEDGLKYQEVADLLGVSVKTVNNQLISAMKSIRMAVANYYKNDQKRPGFLSLRSLFFLLF